MGACSCGGNNENCYKCFGTGIVSAPSKPVRGLPPTIESRESNPSGRTRKKLRGVSGRSSLGSSTFPAFGTTPSVPKAVTPIRVTETTKSKRARVKFKKWLKPGALPGKGQTTSINDAVKAAIGRAPIVPPKRIRAVSKAKITSSAGSKKRPPTLSNTIRPPENPAMHDAFFDALVSGTEKKIERELDATSLYSSIRDHGQFGSHPSHDDYDE